MPGVRYRTPRLTGEAAQKRRGVRAGVSGRAHEREGRSRYITTTARNLLDDAQPGCPLPQLSPCSCCISQLHDPPRARSWE